MYCVRKVTEDLYWVGANDHRLHLFENIHPIPRGVSYNAYLLLDKETVLFDTVVSAGGSPLELACHKSYGTGSRGVCRADFTALSGCKNNFQ